MGLKPIPPGPKEREWTYGDKCGKRQLTFGEAKFALSMAKRFDRSEARSYRCPDCRTWHLTSLDHGLRPRRDRR